MDIHRLRYLRGEGMHKFAEGDLPQAEAILADLIPEDDGISEPWRAGETVLCLQDRATVRRFSNRWHEALDDLSRCERLASRLGTLLRRMTLPNVYYLRAALLAAPDSDIYDPMEAKKAIEQFRRSAGSAWIAELLEADIAFNEREWEKASSLYLTVVGSLEREGWMQGIAGCRSRAGEALIEQRKWSEAEIEVTGSLEFLKVSGPPDMLANAHMNLARIRSAQGRADEAWDLALQSLIGAELLVRHFHDVHEQQQFLKNKARFYTTAFKIAQAQGGIVGRWRAWSIAERAKSFYLCQLVANSDVRLFDGVDPAAIAHLQDLEVQLDRAERKLASLLTSDKPASWELERHFAALSQQKRDLLGSLMKQNPRWAALKIPPPLDIKSELGKLDASWVVLSYFWSMDSTDGATLHLFWSGADRDPQSVSIPWRARDLQLLDELRALLRGRVSAAEKTFPDALAPRVVPPQLLEALGRDSRLLISPHGRLKGIPLHSVPIGTEEFLISRVPVQYIPTLSLLSFRSHATAQSVLLLGCPSDGFGGAELPEVRLEIDNIAAIWRSRCQGNVEAHILPPSGSPKDVGLDVEHWGKFGILHFACHGVFAEGSPFDAALRLGSEAVRASELFAARLTNASVFLSACSLGRHQDVTLQPTGSDEWIGLYLPLFYAGARHLLVSLYDADSRTAMRVMTEIHISLADGMTLAAAFQRAIKIMIEEGTPPALWANWYLTGLPN